MASIEITTGNGVTVIPIPDHCPPEYIIDAITKALDEYRPSKNLNFFIDTFEVFYNAYGKKVGRAPAFKKWLKLSQKDIEKIMETVEEFVRANPDPMFRPHPLTYLNQRRWEDEIVPKAKRVEPKKSNSWMY